jgi:glycosyltransferase involved in cell wall biosynthesis
MQNPRHVQGIVPVSVIIPCFCCDGTIERAVLSIANQVAKPSEVFLVDDGSPDDGRTMQRLQEVKKKYGGVIQIHIVELHTNVGPAIARNKAWNLASQPFVAFLDSDDAWHPRKLEIQYQYMCDHPDVALCGHSHRLLHGGDALPDWPLKSVPIAKAVSKLDMLISNRFITPSVMVKRDIPFRFAEGKWHMEDHLLWMQIACGGLKLVKLPCALAAIYKYPYGAEGLSGQYRQMHGAVLENYRRLGIDGCLSRFAMALLIGLEYLKYLRRLFVISWIKFGRTGG